jgi:putative secretion ATPase (PEP-CTERM system associated)
MYERQYGFSAPPFQLTPDSRFFFASRAHARALAHMTFGLAHDEGFIVVTGEIGAGKTTLIERLLSELDREVFAVARISTTQVSGDDLFRLAMAGFGVNAPQASKATLLLACEEVLREHRMAGRRSLLIVDEVQNLSLEALEELRLLSNLSAGGRASLQTLLVGQPQFRRTLASPELAQLRQRVLAACHLGPIEREETRGYVLHRLTTVGWRGTPSFEETAFDLVYDASGGIPRRINRLCGRVLLAGALQGASEITTTMVAGAAAELARDLEGVPPDLRDPPAPHAPHADAPVRRPWQARRATAAASVT